MIEAVRITLHNALALVGVTAPESIKLHKIDTRACDIFICTGSYII